MRMGAITLLITFSGLAKEENPAPPKLEDAFSTEPVEVSNEPVGNLEEVEPVVVGRNNGAILLQMQNRQHQKTDRQTQILRCFIDQLDALETKAKVDGSGMPAKPPSPPPAVSLHRNFEGTLSLPRKLDYRGILNWKMQAAETCLC